jgi:hypothetical protein
MLRYTYPESGHFGVTNTGTELKDFYFVERLWGTHNLVLNFTVGDLTPKIQEFIGLTAGSSAVNVSFTATGFTSPLTYSVTSGTLPSGLSLNTSTGAITGTPNAAYSQATVRITVVDAASSTDFADVTFQINPAPELYAFTSATFGTGGLTGRFGPDLSQMRSSLGNPTWANNTNFFNQGRAQGYQVWTVPRTATYQIEVAGARGQSGGSTGNTPQGAKIRCNVALTQGDKLEMVVGQTPNPTSTGDASAGSGGGTFVVINGTNTPVVIAGGGAGLYSSFSESRWWNGQTRRQPRWDGYNYSPASLGGQPAIGFGGPGYHAGGGGGLLGGGTGYPGRSYTDANGSGVGGGQQVTHGASFSGSNEFGTFYAIGGNVVSYPNTAGGFGGGGGGHGGNNTGAGGGGYSGGLGGNTSIGGSVLSGIGGGSFIISTATAVSTSDAQYDGISTFNGQGIGNIGYNNGSGYITITRL